jgi:hypothetical protein
MKRVEPMAARRQALAGGATHDAELKRLLAQAGATEHAIAIAAGAVLQVGKQALSYRFGAKGNLPAAQARRVGTQAVTEVIWEGRNHAMHWEESKPGSASDLMLQQLQADGLITIAVGENNAVDILNALGWNTADDVLRELDTLVQL